MIAEFGASQADLALFAKEWIVTLCLLSHAFLELRTPYFALFLRLQSAAKALKSLDSRRRSLLMLIGLRAASSAPVDNRRWRSQVVRQLIANQSHVGSTPTATSKPHQPRNRLRGCFLEVLHGFEARRWIRMPHDDVVAHAMVQ